MYTSPFVWPRTLLINQIGLELFGFRDNTCLMKLFKSANSNLINDSRLSFSFLLPSEILEKKLSTAIVLYQHRPIRLLWSKCGLIICICLRQVYYAG